MSPDLVEIDSSSLWTEAERTALLRQELARDIASAALRSPGPDAVVQLDAGRFVGRPTILRRLGQLLADRLPADVDRLLAVGPVGAALTAAVSLSAGVPFAVVELSGAATGGRIVGDLPAGEQLTLVEPVLDADSDATGVVALVAGNGSEITTILAVVDLASEDAGRLGQGGLSRDRLYCRADVVT